VLSPSIGPPEHNSIDIRTNSEKPLPRPPNYKQDKKRREESQKRKNQEEQQRKAARKNKDAPVGQP
jgi:hypothetical protein